jgi:hypothetical protein
MKMTANVFLPGVKENRRLLEESIFEGVFAEK